MGKTYKARDRYIVIHPNCSAGVPKGLLMDHTTFRNLGKTNTA